jgi:hypothetical protein
MENPYGKLQTIPKKIQQNQPFPHFPHPVKNPKTNKKLIHNPT